MQNQQVEDIMNFINYYNIADRKALQKDAQDNIKMLVKKLNLNRRCPWIGKSEMYLYQQMLKTIGIGDQYYIDRQVALLSIINLKNTNSASDDLETTATDFWNSLARYYFDFVITRKDNNEDFMLVLELTSKYHGYDFEEPDGPIGNCICRSTQIRDLNKKYLCKELKIRWAQIDIREFSEVDTNDKFNFCEDKLKLLLEELKKYWLEPKTYNDFLESMGKWKKSRNQM